MSRLNISPSLYFFYESATNKWFNSFDSMTTIVLNINILMVKALKNA